MNEALAATSFARAWNRLDPSDLISILANDARYAPQWVHRHCSGPGRDTAPALAVAVVPDTGPSAGLSSSKRSSARNGHAFAGRPIGARVGTLDTFDHRQLRAVVAVCRGHNTISDAGRELFNVSLQLRTVINNADRLRKYLLKFGLEWDAVVR